MVADPLTIREARLSDAPALNEIYNWYVANSAATFDLEPMSAERRRAWLDEHPGGPHRVLVALEAERVVGFASSGRFRPRPAYEPTVETSVYVSNTRLGEGIGGRLYEALFDRLAVEELHRACAGISLPNPASEALHVRFGFRPVGRFTEQGFKFGRYWDVGWFEKSLEGHRVGSSRSARY